MFAVLHYMCIWFVFCHGLTTVDLNLNHLLQAREERIVALETENAMLYLKLAQVII